MSINRDLLFGIQEVCIYPKAITNIRSRSQCSPLINGKLPLFTAPMTSVIDNKTYKIYEENNINVIIPRTVPIYERARFFDKCFVAMGLDEMEEYVKLNYKEMAKLESINILIDISNGHMRRLANSIRDLKRIFRNKISIMCGNIANPLTFQYLSEAGADYIRVGIGAGCGCITASNTGIFYPMGSLIYECRKIQEKMEESYRLNGTSKPAKIVADGGMKNYDYIIKSLYLGADYVMCGRLFSQCWESPGEIWYKEKSSQNIHENWKLLGNHSTSEEHLEYQPDIYDYKKIFYGMATKKAQTEMEAAADQKEKKPLKTSEGIIKELPILHRIEGWVENFRSYLTSAMSYTDCLTLKDVKNFKEFRLMTYAAQESYNK